jgi:glyoxylase-like metal-dependent hydrolase (beta-lactamase superfamily II)
MNNAISCLTVGEFSTNCWVYADESGVSVIDPGGNAGSIIAFLQSNGLRPARILLTHGHFDHVLALPEVHAAFPGAEIAVHRADYGYVDKNAFHRHCADFKAAAGDDRFIRAVWRDMPPQIRLLDDGDSAGPFTVIHTPGHTKGSVSYYRRSAGVLFSGDTLFQSGVGRTDLFGGDTAELRSSLTRLFALDDETRVFPGHGEATVIGLEK